MPGAEPYRLLLDVHCELSNGFPQGAAHGEARDRRKPLLYLPREFIGNDRGLPGFGDDSQPHLTLRSEAEQRFAR